MKNAVRVHNVFLKSGIEIKNLPILTDKFFDTSCPSCKESQSLDQCSITVDNEETIYKCKNGCQTILIVSPPGNDPIPGRGYRMKDYVIRNVSDLYVRIPNSKDVLLPASPAALI
ncbi:growth hormone receptor binding protein [Paenibacillus sp. MER 78]|uniref:growth hormone receptor binding protein n=1 Tax=Paenibacillus sp. MER 78 TaxID=2939571 RepID=UPI00203FAE35|nr:growth hormone receptor binding protein [Paenibacillus sp. MER 78]MCM3130935.1 growth hormone receptor binding protein [Paenibacillus sp. MER 78]